MPTPHICRVDCDPQPVEYANGQTGTAHMMYASEPSSAAGRYQWELNRAILNAGRRAWRASGQGQSRECRIFDYRRATEPAEVQYIRYGVGGRRLSRELAMFDPTPDPVNGETWEDYILVCNAMEAEQHDM